MSYVLDISQSFNRGGTTTTTTTTAAAAAAATTTTTTKTPCQFENAFIPSVRMLK